MTIFCPKCTIVLSVLFFFSCYGDHRERHVLTHSFPTRRSSDLSGTNSVPIGPSAPVMSTLGCFFSTEYVRRSRVAAIGEDDLKRSEEHTSELQSLMRSSYAGFCL